MKGSQHSVKLSFLGGVGEVGKNMMVLECGDDMIVIDAGVAFPSDNMPGIDLVIPDYSYLMANKKKVKAVFLTHGHEDHIGAIPYLMHDINVPIYGSRLTTIGLHLAFLCSLNLFSTNAQVNLLP